MLRLVNTAEQASACLPIGTFLLPLYVNLIGSSGGEGRDEAGCLAPAGIGDGRWVSGSGTWILPPESAVLFTNQDDGAREHREVADGRQTWRRCNARSGTAPHLLTFYAQLVNQVKVPAADIGSDERYNLGLGTRTLPPASSRPSQPGSAAIRLSLAERCGSPPRKTTTKQRDGRRSSLFCFSFAGR